MEEKTDFNDLFDNYKPRMSSGEEFASSLFKVLDAVETVRSENLELKRRNRISAFIASIAGFLMGVITTFLYPYINLFIINIIAGFSFNSVNLNPGIEEASRVLTWASIGILSVMTALSVYRLTFITLKKVKE